ncbi:MAG: tetratricopeptide repeat protein, partial [Candidatus Omnitrophica bacterium]|nr:tetratricopeptide repeat protein [Candidatus Omnitrophota bacterium]MCM8803069.1 tetratricopeptide repeat protein [Candidatus Omnitrophota bacterium]
GFFIYFILLIDRIKKEKLKIILTTLIFLLYGTRTILRNYDWKQPEELYIKSLRYSFYPAQLYGNLAYLYIINGQPEKAYQLLHPVIERGFKTESILYMYGVSLKNLRIYQQAEKIFLEVIKINPKNYEALTELGEIYFLKNEIEKAKKTLEKSLDLKREYPKTYFILCQICQIKGEKEEAIYYLDRLINFAPDDFYPYYIKGLILKQNSEFEKANENFKIAYSILKKRNDFYSIFNLGLLLKEMNRIDEALDTFNYLKKLKPEDIEIMNEIGICYALKGEELKAKEIWESILKKDPLYYPARENLKKLSEN